MAGIEGPATLSEIMLSFDEDIEGLIVPMEYLDTDVFGIARPHNSHSNLSSREHTDTDRRPHRVSTLRQPPSTLLGFRSILIAQVIYDTQNFMTRQSTHARFAAHLQQRVPLMMSRIAYHREKANDVVGVMTCVATLARTFWEGGLEEEMRIFLQKLMGLAGGGWGSLDVGQRAEWLMMLAEAYIEKGDSMKANETILSVFKLVKIYYPKTPFGRKFYRWLPSTA
ncbi:hypothetical protein BC829DRAFT_123041 [Chytridium lagenaria]|nr:hypothetical protein BC829DRAFT_123041 [Chytridium lagenaria]